MTSRNRPGSRAAGANHHKCALARAVAWLMGVGSPHQTVSDDGDGRAGAKHCKPLTPKIASKCVLSDFGLMPRIYSAKTIAKIGGRCR